MIKTLRKMWKSNWGKAAMVGVGLVGYGVASKAFPQTLPSISDSFLSRTFKPDPGTGFLTDVKGKLWDIATMPTRVGEALGGTTFDYFMGRGNTTWANVQKSLSDATGGWFTGAKDLISGYRAMQGGQPTGDPGQYHRKGVVHEKISPITVGGGAAQIAAAGDWGKSGFKPGGLANQFTALAHSDQYYPKIHNQTFSYGKPIGQTIDLKRSGILNVTKPSFRYTA